MPHDVPALDPSQRAVLELADAASAVVLGAPGTGKTTTLVELVADRVLGRGLDPDTVLALAATRATATRLRDRLARRLGVPTNGPLARTAASLEFEVVAAAAARAGLSAPRLVSGAEQDRDLAELLAGDLADGTGPSWPDELGAEVRSLASFRAELRDLLARATEYGIDPQRMRRLAAAHGRPEWAAAADFADEYRRVVTASRPDQLDGAELAQFAIAAVADGGAGERVDRLRLVVVDDLQEATASTVHLLRALAARGVAVVAFGDPDVASNAFRGGEPERVGRFGADLGAPTLLLDRDHRHGVELRGLVARVTARIGAAAAGTQRRVTAAGGGTDAAPAVDRVGVRAGATAPVATIAAATPAREIAAIARELRIAHLERGVPWGELAVVVRSGSAADGIRRSLALAEVPTRAAASRRPLREHRAARALLDLVSVGVGREPLDAASATALLTGPFGGLDRLALRRLKLALRAEELAGGGTRTADALLVEALEDPARLATIDHRVGRRATRLAQTLAALRAAAGAGAGREGAADARATGAGAAGPASVEELLWLAWERSGLAEPWRQQALGAGLAAAEADDALDGIVAVFAAARDYVERVPAGSAVSFLRRVLEESVGDDTLAPASAVDAVVVTTPAGAVGLEVDTVVIAQLQEGVWPNLRLRGSMLGAADLVRAATDPDAPVPTIDERRAVLDDELRQFALAVSRARTRVVLSGVENDDTARSPLVAFAPADAEVVDVASAAPFTLRGAVGRMRRQLSSPRATVAERAAAASGLAQLARAGVPGADPDDWHGLRSPSTDVPLYVPGEDVPVSPSQLGRFEESPLDWFLGLVTDETMPAIVGLGTILHWAMETATDPSVDGLLAAVESRWGELLFESPWLAERHRRMARTFATGIAGYLADAAASGAAVVGAEKRFELPVEIPADGDEPRVERAVIRGSIDRVERQGDGRVLIVDLKTGTPEPPKRIPEHPQLSAYQLAYASGALDDVLAEHGEHSGGGARLLWVKERTRDRAYKTSDQEPFDAEAVERFRDRIRVAALGMAVAEYQGLIEPAGRGGAPGWSVLVHRVGQVSGD
ncbi:PD-(D/E)XK nuclease family protein [Galbitalea sp. SE-J8]|uniref:UrvD/REP family ATP-dependent DNA helicase n=1 Tax=Galbitalea sp. SE-J8 TaxID=3054952 RepID=UPI00259D126C|nr:UrvD/REP family ATP-dependent DNA helicase [Galbitalea sp. SE-J8]MDM4763513.1 PD-(D/E)XK nuclease family protein [Galbitalea sp. SE-J8]